LRRAFAARRGPSGAIWEADTGWLAIWCNRNPGHWLLVPRSVHRHSALACFRSVPCCYRTVACFLGLSRGNLIDDRLQTWYNFYSASFPYLSRFRLQRYRFWDQCSEDRLFSCHRDTQPSFRVS
jgi:hypothetical protein